MTLKQSYKSVEDKEKQLESIGTTGDHGKEAYISLLAKGFSLGKEEISQLMADGEHHGVELSAPAALKLGIITEIIETFPWIK